MNHALLLLTCLLAAPALAKVQVVATITDLGSLAAEAGGDLVEVTTLARSTQDPHFVDARHSLVLGLSKADLLVHVGMEMETGWLPTLLTSSRNGRIQVGAPGNLNCATLIQPLEVPAEKIERAMGDIHPGGNPHYTKDPRNAVPLVRGMAARLAAVDPDHAATYQQNAARFEARLREKLSGWEAALRPFRGTTVITFHRSWSYLSAWAGFEQVAFMEPKPGLPPSAQHVAQVLITARARKVPLVLQEDWYSAQASELVAQKSGARLVRVPGMVPEGQGYLDYVDRLVAAVTAALPAAAPPAAAR
ncbi:MAG: zinc ABC transporter substrate-binding protein [Deltaproteobacteria bacterium]|nr:zinc ABC transporter substrate-binding protein [Deltaproteobacteria bacterium]